jgi:4'-phosphopantetheinyl transferase
LNRAPGPSQLAPGVIHVWRADLDHAVEGADLLTSSERDRAAQYRFEADRKRWTSSRSILRRLLGIYLGEDPRLVSIGVGEHGKPELLPRRAPPIDAPSPLQFNLSHSGSLALYAFAIDNPVGVDVELASRLVDPAAIARSIPGIGDAVRLAELEEPERSREVLRVWVRTEAALKCRGTGLAAQAQHTVPHEPWVVDLDVGAESAAALAAANPPAGLRTFEWGVVGS